MTAGHGPNIGHGYVKYVVIDEHGVELTPVVFPAIIGRAQGGVSGALVRAETVTIDGIEYWAGEDARQSREPRTNLTQARLSDPLFIPVLARTALQRLGHLNGAATGVCVTGLPATWSKDADKARALGERLRRATDSYKTIKVIAEPLGLIYSLLLDTNGRLAGDPALQAGRVGVIDLGHYTDDICIVDQLRPQMSSLATYTTGTRAPLDDIRNTLTAAFERDFSLFEVDQAVREGGVRVRGQWQPLPANWDAPLRSNATQIVNALIERWGRAADLDTILIGGGGAEEQRKVAAIQAAFPHAQVVPDPQIAVARGYAKLARRFAGDRNGS